MQGAMLQVSIPTLSPLQGRPPKAAAGSVPDRYRRLTPTSQVRLQELHWVQPVQPQSTTDHTHKEQNHQQESKGSEVFMTGTRQGRGRIHTPSRHQHTCYSTNKDSL